MAKKEQMSAAETGADQFEQMDVINCSGHRIDLVENPHVTIVDNIRVPKTDLSDSKDVLFTALDLGAAIRKALLRFPMAYIGWNPIAPMTIASFLLIYEDAVQRQVDLSTIRLAWCYRPLIEDDQGNLVVDQDSPWLWSVNQSMTLGEMVNQVHQELGIKGGTN